MRTSKNKAALKAPSKGPVSDYVETVEIEPRTVRAPSQVWNRIAALAKRQNCSVNEMIVACLEKVCEDENVA